MLLTKANPQLIVVMECLYIKSGRFGSKVIFQNTSLFWDTFDLYKGGVTSEARTLPLSTFLRK